MKLAACLPAALLLMTGCVPISTTTTLLSQKTYPSKPKDCDIQVLTQAPADRKFEELAILNTLAIEPIYGKDLNAMLPSLKEAACQLGADALLIRSVAAGSPSERSSGKVFSVAIKFID